jgi:C4-dicarboxylate transporter DctM subunit
VPIGLELGCDPLHLGVIFCINLVVGFITPPFGVNLFTAVSVTETPYAKVVKGVIPFMIVAMAAVLVLAFVPQIILFLPNMM